MRVPSPRSSVESLPLSLAIRRLIALESSPLAELITPLDHGVEWGRAADLLFEELLEAIRTLRVLPGLLLVEAEIAAIAQVGRGPAREAVARLTEAGLVTLVPQVGTIVARIRWPEVERALGVREGLEMYVFASMCGAQTRDTTIMRELIDVQRAAAESHDSRAFIAACEQFQDELRAGAGFAAGRTSVQTPHFHLDRARRLTPLEPTTVITLVEEHTVIADAVESGNAAIGQHALLSQHRRLRRSAAEAYAAHPEYFVD